GHRNDDKGKFTEISDQAGLETFWPWGIATGDFDKDGRLDIVTNNFNDRPYFFKNRLPRQNHVAFRLRGTRSNRDAIGVVARFYQGEKVMSRQVLGACGYLSQSSRVLHLGLGDKPEIDRVEIHWPSGVRQRLDAVAANRLHEIVERARSGRLY
ncbi:MAG TPA: CRTAC1 family protein, partial [Gemmataceae bacterium]|nr:CRTAC1 family protein [Gemmataceae bacterium]